MTRQNRRFIGVLITIIGCIMATSCAAGGSTSPDVTPTKAETTASTPANVIGTWVSEKSNDTSFEAVVENGQIQVFLVSGETKSLFWKGTFPDATAPGEIVSVGDREALDASMMGSSETEKPFTFTGDELNFEFSMMGTSTIVHTTKK